MQVSQSQVFLLVEGWSDRFFYSSLAETLCRQVQVRYDVTTAQELPGPSFGKPALLEFYLYLRGRRALFTDLKGKKTAILFCLDKDVDDFRRISKRSSHISYTEHVDVENYLFIHGDVIRADAAAAALDPQLVRAHLGDPLEWRRRTATHWKSWTTLCLANQVLQLGGPCSYGQRLSLVNAQGFGAEDPVAINRLVSHLRTRSKLSRTEFDSRLARTHKLVQRLYDKDQWDKVFKGKWYPVWLARDVLAAAAGRQVNANRLEDRIRHSLALTLDFSAAWTQTLSARLRRVAEKVL